MIEMFQKYIPLVRKIIRYADDVETVRPDNNLNRVEPWQSDMSHRNGGHPIRP